MLVTAVVKLPQEVLPLELLPLAETGLTTLAALLAGATAVLEKLENYYHVMPTLHASYQWVSCVTVAYHAVLLLLVARLLVFSKYQGKSFLT